MAMLAPRLVSRALRRLSLALLLGAPMACGLDVDPTTLEPAHGAGGAGGSAACPAQGATCPDPGSSSVRVFLREGGAIQGVAIDPAAPRVQVDAGQPIEGTVHVTVMNEFVASAVVPLFYTPSWGEHATSVHVVSANVKQTSDWDVALSNLVAPTVPGTYYLVFAADAQCGACHIASGTKWHTCGATPDCELCSCAAGACDSPCMHWNDGFDVADLDEAALCPTIERGYVSMPIWMGQGHECTTFGAAHVTIEVL